MRCGSATRPATHDVHRRADAHAAARGRQPTVGKDVGCPVERSDHSHEAEVAIVVPKQAHWNTQNDGASAVAYLNRYGIWGLVGALVGNPCARAIEREQIIPAEGPNLPPVGSAEERSSGARVVVDVELDVAP